MNRQLALSFVTVAVAMTALGAPERKLDSWGRAQGAECRPEAKAVPVSSSALALAKPFSDGAVLQRERPVAVWGTAKPGAAVRLSFGEFSADAVADEKGNWKARLPTMPASAEPRILRVTCGQESAEAKDILVGEVWLVSGQSNAVCPFWCTLATRFRGNTRAGLIVQYVDKPLVRFSDTPGEWKRMNRKNLVKTTTIEAGSCSGSFSELGTYFALKLHDVLGVPVGVIGEYVNGSPIEIWIPPDGCLWNAHLVRWLPYTIRGVIWNQGDSNIKNADEYDRLSLDLYRKWSQAFENPNMSFYFQEQSHGDGSCFRLRLAQQRFAAACPNAAICGGCDIINPCGDLHGNDKEAMARRMLVHALKRDYGFADIEDESPTFRSLVPGPDGRVTVTFSHAKNLFIYNDGMTDYRIPMEVCGKDGKWHKAAAEFPKLKNWSSQGLILSSNLTVRASEVKHPVKIRYMYAGKANIFNEVCLPVLSFEADVPAAEDAP